MRSIVRWFAILAVSLAAFVCSTLSTHLGTSYFGMSASAQTTPQTEAPKTAPKSFLPPKAGSTPGVKTETAPPPSGLLAGFYTWVAQQQRGFSAALASALRDIKAGNALSASLVLIAFSFAYGILHAAGPGHGKAIVSSYMLTDGQTVRRGIQLAFLSSFIQALAAIALYGIVVLVLRGARTEIVATETLLERTSWLIVAGFGAWLLYRQVRALWSGYHAHDHAHHHHSHVGGAKPEKALVTADVQSGHHVHDHGHHHHHGHDQHSPGETCDTCGHAHMPAATELQGEWSWKRAITLALGVGIRPCTGAIGVLFVASGLGLMWAGIVSTIVMSIGTAITVSALAALAVSSRDLATRLAGASDNSVAARAQTAFGLAGAALVFLLGTTFFYYSLTTPTPI